MAFENWNLNPTHADGTNNLLAKILARLQLNAGVTPDAPASNVAITNWPAGPFSVSVSGVPTVAVEGATFQDGHLSVVAVPFDFEIQHEGHYLENGVEKEAFYFRVLGRRNGFNSVSVLQDVGEWLAGTTDSLPELTGAENLELVSSSVQDSAAGTGIRTVRITYLTTGYVITTAVYALNGTTPVPVAEQMLFVYGLEAVTVGGSNYAVGNIDLRIAGAGAIHERISASASKSRTCRFMVPDNYKAYIGQWTSYAIGTTIDLRFLATVSTFDRSLVAPYITQDTAYLGAGQSTTQVLRYSKCPARSKIKVAVLPGLLPAGNRVDVDLDILLIQD